MSKNESDDVNEARAYWWAGRIRRTSALEVFASYAIFGIIFAAYLVESARDDLTKRIFEAVYEPRILIAALFVFAEIFVNVLTGRAILVGLFARRFNGQPTQRQPGNDTSESKPVEREFFTYIGRSTRTLGVAQGRPNALLIVGTTVAMSGLAFFIATLPGFHIVPSAAVDTAPSIDITERFLELAPRLLMLLFIQVLAGFFLRQYRLSLEELRYYESILRVRETQFLAYRILSESNDEKIQGFAQSLVAGADKDTLRLQKGETTVILEAQKLEVNEFKSISDKLFELIKVPAASKSKGAEPS